MREDLVGQTGSLRRVGDPPSDIRENPAGGLPVRRRLPASPTILAILLLASCVKPRPLPVLGDAPAFQLTTQTGAVFDSKSLEGQIWVADFIYTTCPGPCPMMTRQMRQIQDRTAQEMHDVKLVSFTVDPTHDTPPVLEEYAKHYRMDPSRWWFLTGNIPALNTVGMGFKLNTIDGNLSHSTRFVLIDRQNRIRGYYLTDDDAFLPQLIHDIRQLEQDPS